jgi:hypothetical protein
MAVWPPTNHENPLPSFVKGGLGGFESHFLRNRGLPFPYVPQLIILFSKKVKKFGRDIKAVHQYGYKDVPKNLKKSF